MNAEGQRTCPSCGNELSGVMEFCPVCMLRVGLAGEVESGGSSASEDIAKPTTEQAGHRFENYEIVKGEDGIPVELGRGAMGVTYKAFDVDLRCPVTLKSISVMNRRGFVFYAKRAPRRAFDTRMLRRFSTWAEGARITFMRWSL